MARGRLSSPERHYRLLLMSEVFAGRTAFALLESEPDLPGQTRTARLGGGAAARWTLVATRESILLSPAQGAI